LANLAMVRHTYASSSAADDRTLAHDITNNLPVRSQLAESAFHLVREAMAALRLYLSLWLTRFCHLTVSLRCHHTTNDGLIM
jgi:hypothetical protein